jgi:hypothetical protein
MTLSSLREAAAVTIHTKATLYPIMPEPTIAPVAVSSAAYSPVVQQHPQPAR